MIDDQQRDEPTDSLPVHSINIDRSREKSLYFLLLAVGRQRATSKEAIRMEYRTALKNLTVEKLPIDVLPSWFEITDISPPMNKEKIIDVYNKTFRYRCWRVTRMIV